MYNQWIKNYAPESVVFEIQKEKPKIKFDDLQNKCIKLLIEKINELVKEVNTLKNS